MDTWVLDTDEVWVDERVEVWVDEIVEVWVDDTVVLSQFRRVPSSIAVTKSLKISAVALQSPDLSYTLSDTSQSNAKGSGSFLCGPVISCIA